MRDAANARSCYASRVTSGWNFIGVSSLCHYGAQGAKRRDGHQGDEQDHDRQRTSERPVESRSELADNDIRNHDAARSSQEGRSHEIPEAQREGEDAARDDAWNAERQKDSSEGLPWRGTQIEARFGQLLRDLFQRRVNRQSNQRNKDVCQRQTYAELVVEEKGDRLLDQAEILKRGVDNAGAAQNRLPNEGPQQKASEQGNDDQEVEQLAMTGCDEEARKKANG